MVLVPYFVCFPDGVADLDTLDILDYNTGDRLFLFYLPLSVPPTYNLVYFPPCHFALLLQPIPPTLYHFEAGDRDVYFDYGNEDHFHLVFVSFVPGR